MKTVADEIQAQALRTAQRVVVEARSQYGGIAYHPVNEIARSLAEIAGTRTLTPHVLKIARERFGFVIEVKESAQMAAARNAFGKSS